MQEVVVVFDELDKVSKDGGRSASGDVVLGVLESGGKDGGQRVDDCDALRFGTLHAIHTDLILMEDDIIHQAIIKDFLNVTVKVVQHDTVENDCPGDWEGQDVLLVNAHIADRQNAEFYWRLLYQGLAFSKAEAISS